MNILRKQKIRSDDTSCKLKNFWLQKKEKKRLDQEVEAQLDRMVKAVNKFISDRKNKTWAS